MTDLSDLSNTLRASNSLEQVKETTIEGGSTLKNTL